MVSVVMLMTWAVAVFKVMRMVTRSVISLVTVALKGR